MQLLTIAKHKTEAIPIGKYRYKLQISRTSYNVDLYGNQMNTGTSANVVYICSLYKTFP